MADKRRQKLKKRIRMEMSGEKPDRKIREAVERLPKRQKDLILDRLEKNLNWDKIAENRYYSERQARNLFNEGLDQIQRSLAENRKHK